MLPNGITLLPSAPPLRCTGEWVPGSPHPRVLFDYDLVGLCLLSNVSSVLSPPPSFCIISPRRRCLRWKTLKLCIFSSRVHFLDYLSPLSITRKNSHLCGIQVDTPTPFSLRLLRSSGSFRLTATSGSRFPSSAFSFLSSYADTLYNPFVTYPYSVYTCFVLFVYYLCSVIRSSPVRGKLTHTHTHGQQRNPGAGEWEFCPTLLSRLFAWPFSPATLHYLQ